LGKQPLFPNKYPTRSQQKGADLTYSFTIFDLIEHKKTRRLAGFLFQNVVIF